MIRHHDLQQIDANDGRLAVFEITAGVPGSPNCRRGRRHHFSDTVQIAGAMTTPILEPVGLGTRRAGPTHARFGVMAFIVGLAAVTYLDRACISTLAPQIQNDLNLDKPQMSLVFSSFAIAYAIFEIPTAWWAQKRGTRRVLSRIVLWWSVLTLATAAVVTPWGVTNWFPKLAPAVNGGAAWMISFWVMMTVRFLFGLGEAGAWPCAAASYARWIPAKERGIAQGLLFAGAHISGGLTPLLVIFLRDHAHMNWRAIFVLFGMVGFVWAGGWYWWFRDDPSEHKGVGAEELALIVEQRRPPTAHTAGWAYWVKLMTHRNTLPLCLMYIGNSYAYFFCITWLPTYVKEKHHMADAMLGIAAGLPLCLSVVGDIFGGLTTDWMSKKFGLWIGRSGLGAAMYAVAAVSMTIAALAGEPWVAIGFLSLAVASVMFTLGAAWSTVIDVSGHHTGMVGAVMNTAGNTAAIFSPIVAIYVKDNWGGWNSPLFVMAALFGLGAVSWLFIDPTKPIFDEPKDAAGFEVIQ